MVLSTENAIDDINEILRAIAIYMFEIISFG